MDYVAEFITRYRREFDFYEQSCRLVAQMLESSLRSAGLRAIVTSRAKNPIRLEAKVRQRNAKKNYADVNKIYDDIVDLAGVRVALYFPAERSQAAKVIRDLFTLASDAKEFPPKDQPVPNNNKRFSGYWATHYRVRIPEAALSEAQKRYSEAIIEIQVASVLMHAWSEVEHDLVYKPLQGTLSVDEYAILDELNGLMLAGEIALERLQRAGEARASTHGREFSNHYDLAAALIELARVHLAGTTVDDAALGRVDMLFQLLKSFSLNKPDALVKYFQILHTDFETRPLSDQIIDQLLVEEPDRYAAWESMRLNESPNQDKAQDSMPTSTGRAIVEFLKYWVEYEKHLRGRIKALNLKVERMSAPFLLKRIGLPENLVPSAQWLRVFRNHVVHGIDTPQLDVVNAATSELKVLIQYMENTPPDTWMQNSVQ